MTTLFAVIYDPNDGPRSVILVRATDEQAAREYVLQWFHRNDVDMMTLNDLRAIDLGLVEDVTDLANVML